METSFGRRCSRFSLQHREWNAGDGWMALHVHGTIVRLFLRNKVVERNLIYKIDHDAASTFFGYATAANKAAHVTFTFVFAIWAYKSSSIR